MPEPHLSPRYAGNYLGRDLFSTHAATVHREPGETMVQAVDRAVATTRADTPIVLNDYQARDLRVEFLAMASPDQMAWLCRADPESVGHLDIVGTSATTPEGPDA